MFVLFLEINHRYLLLLWDSISLSRRLGCSEAIIAPCSLEFLGSSNPLASSSQVAGITHACYHAWLNFNCFCRDRVLLYCLGWSQTPRLKHASCFGLSKCQDYRHEPLCPVRLVGGFVNNSGKFLGILLLLNIVFFSFSQLPLFGSSTFFSPSHFNLRISQPPFPIF